MLSFLRWKHLLGVFPTILLAASLVAGCGSDANSKEPEDEEEETDPALPVEAAATRTGSIAAFFVGTASLETENEALVVAKSAGIVKSIFAEEGSFVRAGSSLAQLDDERVRLEVSRAEATLRQLEQDYERKKGFYDKQLISTEEFEQARSAFETQKAAFDLTKLSLQETTVIAPISGIVSERLIKVGNMVQAQQSTFRITDFDPLLALMHVPERELNKLRVGQTADVRVDAFPADNFSGRIKRISPVIDPATGTFKVTIEVRDRSSKLKPGMFARIKVVYDRRDGTLLVPKQAVVSEDDESVVYVVRDSMSFRQLIDVGYRDDRNAEVVSGLADGDVVITTGQANLRDSTRVEVIDTLATF